MLAQFNIEEVEEDSSDQHSWTVRSKLIATTETSVPFLHGVFDPTTSPFHQFPFTFRELGTARSPLHGPCHRHDGPFVRGQPDDYSTFFYNLLIEAKK
jgi:hypothetical protein